MIYLLDTTICINIIKRHPHKAFAHFRGLHPGDVCISAISVSELQYGVAKSSKPTESQLGLTTFLATVQILDFSAAASISIGKIRAHVEHKRKTIGNYDLLIAAHALI